MSGHGPVVDQGGVAIVLHQPHLDVHLGQAQLEVEDTEDRCGMVVFVMRLAYMVVAQL